ncbi:MAG TPA: ribosome maturation factor RimP [Tissierellia bacterium]|nr:ribosome maturation factor RimP [Tissierellia bacterium]
MGNKRLISTIRQHCEPIIEEMGYDLVDLEYVKENNENYLKFYIGKREGITIDDCQRVSEAVGDKLDELDPIQESYYLEVSSPGLDRPLKTDKDLRRNLGKEVEVNLYKSLEGKKKYVGELVDFTDNSIRIKMDNSEEKEIARDIISNIKLALKF